MFNRHHLRNALLMVAVSFAACTFATGDNILHDFTGDDGVGPKAPMTLDSSGNLYGTTFDRGPKGKGTVFMLSLNSDGTRTFTLLHSFPDFVADGTTPQSGVTLDSAGNLYGVTAGGGQFGTGVLYQIAPSKGAYTILHSFHRSAGDGVNPFTTPVIDSSGNIYGATLKGGTSNQGVVFQLSPQRGGTWAENIIYNLPQSTAPAGRMDMVIDSDGTLYISRFTGGANGSGVVFALSSSDGKSWSATILHNFGIRGSGDPAYPSGITLDAAGNIFGLTSFGGPADMGCLFELPRNFNGSFGPLKRIYSFKGRPDGTLPAGSPAVDSQGNIYGATTGGGSKGVGIVVRFSPSDNGWTGKLLHNFTDTPDGSRPAAGPTVDPAGNIYGTTFAGGASHAGTVWQITP